MLVNVNDVRIGGDHAALHGTALDVWPADVGLPATFRSNVYVALVT